MNDEPEQMTSERARPIDQGIDTAFRFLHQAFFEDSDLLLEVPSRTTLSLHRELGQAIEAAERTRSLSTGYPRRDVLAGCNIPITAHLNSNNLESSVEV